MLQTTQVELVMSDTVALITRHGFDVDCYGGKRIGAIFSVRAPGAVSLRAPGVSHTAWWP